MKRLNKLGLDGYAIDDQILKVLHALAPGEIRNYAEVVVALGVDLDISPRTVVSILRRLTSEGIPFLTLALPRFVAGVLMYLESADPIYLAIPGFSLVGGIPKLFRDELIVITLSDDHTAIASALGKVYQVCSFFKKMEPTNGITHLQALDALTAYEETEDILPELIEEDALLKYANTYAHSIFTGFDVDCLYATHGPGSVCDQPIAHKHKFIPHLPDSLSSVVGFQDNDHFTSEFWKLGGRDHTDFFRTSSHSEFLVVPKDARGPRTICREPTARMQFQQGLRRYMESAMDKSDHTRGMINFTDQTKNSTLALENSVTRKYATVDLKDASDRLSLALAYRIFKGLPLFDAMMDARSEKVLLPCGDMLHLKKFAPQGSAICFTTLSFTCWVLCRSFLDGVGSDEKVYVFGDDLVVPSEHYESIVKVLERYGLKVNTNKSFSSSHFRESCGTDAYYGVDITPVKLRRQLDATKLGDNPDSGVFSLASTIHQLWGRRYFCTASLIYALMSQDLPPGTGGEPYATIPHDLSGESLEDYAKRHKGNVCLVNGLKLATFRGYTVKVKTVESGESPLNFFHRVLLPSMGNSEVQASVQYGKFDIPRTTRIVKKRVKVLIHE